MKDDVLDQFMQRASEFEMAAGPKPEKSPSKKRSCNLSQAQIAAQRDPHRFFTQTRFENMFAKKLSKSQIRNNRDYQSGSPMKGRKGQNMDL